MRKFVKLRYNFKLDSYIHGLFFLAAFLLSSSLPTRLLTLSLPLPSLSHCTCSPLFLTITLQRLPEVRQSSFIKVALSFTEGQNYSLYKGEAVQVSLLYPLFFFFFFFFNISYAYYCWKSLKEIQQTTVVKGNHMIYSAHITEGLSVPDQNRIHIYLSITSFYINVPK